MENTFFMWMSDTISSDWAALLIRLTIGIPLLPYALKKLRHTPDEPDKFFPVFGMSPRNSFYIAMIIETAASVGCIFGFCTRLVALLGIGNMGVATWKAHDKYWEATAMPYFFGFIAIFLIGAGKFSLDYLFM